MTQRSSRKVTLTFTFILLEKNTRRSLFSSSLLGALFIYDLCANVPRVILLEFLSDPNELALYKSMTLENGWCKHFDQENRACTIFEDRPRFCRVETDTFGDMYGIDSGDMDEFCTACCKDQIGLVYGSKRRVTVPVESLSCLRVRHLHLPARHEADPPKYLLYPMGRCKCCQGDGALCLWMLSKRLK